MWHSALAAAGAVMQYHYFIGGLGGVITVIVGGVISAIAIRSGKRTAVRPATNPEPAPAARRPAPPVRYGEPAPPTSPARRLHPGPISLSEPASPQRDDDNDDETPSSLFNPDLTPSAAADEPPLMTLAELVQTPPPVLRPHKTLAEEWRANAAPPHSPELTHAPIWNHTPFAQPDVSGAAPLTFDVSAAPEPPIWRVGSLSQRLSFASAPGDVAPPVESLTTAAPVWTSWLRPAIATESVALPEAPATADGAEPEPPIWQSFLRRG